MTQNIPSYIPKVKPKDVQSHTTGYYVVRDGLMFSLYAEFDTSTYVFGVFQHDGEGYEEVNRASTSISFVGTYTHNDITQFMSTCVEAYKLGLIPVLWRTIE